MKKDAIMTIMLTAVITSIFGAIGTAVAQPLVSIAQSTGWLDPDTYSVVSQYCEDLTEEAKEGKLHDAVGRDKEINTIMDILTRNGKGNPCIVGDSGVGKTAVVEGLAYRIANKTAPEAFLDKTILKVNFTSLLAGKAYNNGNGAVGRLRALLDKAKENKNIILFFDEGHQLSMYTYVQELIKMYLDRGAANIIIATTSAEYTAHIGNVPPLARRFTCVHIDEPTQHQTLEILKNLRENMEATSGVKLSDESLMSAVELSGQYIKNRSYPDKAIDVINSAVNVALRRNSKDLSEEVPSVTEEDIKSVISAETNIPLGKVSDIEVSLLDSMEERIKCRIVGQDNAVKSVCDAVRKGRIGVRDLTRPRASFLFTGTSGVGKTYLAEVLGEEVGSFVKIDMSQYSSGNSAAELTGSRINGYKGELIEKVCKNPYSVVLFDRIEKASPEVLNAITGILENGFVVDSSGNKVDFSNTIIIITTDVGGKILLNANQTQGIDELTRGNVINEISNILGNNILNKVDQTIVFNKIEKKDFKKIVEIFVNSLESQLSTQNISLKISDDVISNIADVDISDKIGARQFRKIIIEKIEKPMAAFMIKNDIEKGATITCNIIENKIKFEIEK